MLKYVFIIKKYYQYYKKDINGSRCSIFDFFKINYILKTRKKIREKITINKELSLILQLVNLKYIS